ncbi:alpha/beta-hydrolase [Cadophora sp. DSE1049]|nr:alpha/beta-hydrolase [Cadophora sp. DSE1049]
MAFPMFPVLSPLISETKTFVYKTVGDIPIQIDTFIPTKESLKGGPVPVMLFLHGGAWIGGDRTEYCRPLFHEFLAAGFVVNSADYRLLPETPFLGGQLEDVKDVERWLRKTLPLKIESYNLDVDVENIVVVGSSAGALLALLTPSLWAKSPTAILSIYGPTNLHHLPYMPKGPFAQMELPECTSDMLISATNYANPPTGTTPPNSKEDFLDSRRVMGMTMFRNAVTAEFLLRGLVNFAEKGEPLILSLPEKGTVGKDEINKISKPSYNLKFCADSVSTA